MANHTFLLSCPGHAPRLASESHPWRQLLDFSGGVMILYESLTRASCRLSLSVCLRIQLKFLYQYRLALAAVFNWFLPSVELIHHNHLASAPPLRSKDPNQHNSPSNLPQGHFYRPKLLLILEPFLIVTKRF